MKDSRPELCDIATNSSLLGRANQGKLSEGGYSLYRFRELVASCPKCKTFETLYFEGEVMVPTKSFRQNGDSKVYHICPGPDVPCRLFPRFPGEWECE
jgi:hypothetical protein